MKRLLMFAVALVISTTSMAQKQKIGHVDVQAILVDLAVRDSFQFKINKKQLEFQKVLDYEKTRVETQIQNFMKGIQSGAIDKNSEFAQAEQNRLLQEKDRVYNQIPQQLQNQLMNFQAKLEQPLMDTLQAAIKRVSKGLALAYVHDESGLLYVGDGSVDITKQVRIALGLPEEGYTEAEIKAHTDAAMQLGNPQGATGYPDPQGAYPPQGGY